MWDKINKVQAQVIACMVIICGSFGLAYMAALGGLPKSAELLVNKITDVALMGAVAWLFTMSKNGNGTSKPNQ
jgi:hypothetical protein